MTSFAACPFDYYSTAYIKHDCKLLKEATLECGDLSPLLSVPARQPPWGAQVGALQNGYRAVLA